MNLLEYAAQINVLAGKFQAYLDSQNETLSFDNVDAWPDVPLEIQETRLALMSACLNLNDLVDTPRSFITVFPLTAVHDVGALRILWHYRLHQLVPRHGTISYEELAASVKLEYHRLVAYMRHLITRRIFREPEPGRVAHSAASALIADNESLQCWIANMVDDTLEAVLALPRTYDAHGMSLDPNLSPFNIARDNTSVSSLDLVISDPERGARFAKGITWVPTTTVGSTEANLKLYPWDQYGLIVDVGGGSGHFSASVAKQSPDTRFIVQDIPAQAALFKAPEEFASRMEFQVHDFFKPQPVKADAYVLRTVLHDWSDEKSAEILRNLLPALKSDARIILVEISLQDPATAPIAWARVEAAVNSHLHCHCGRERTAKDWAEVVQMASPELEILRIVSQAGSLFSIIEIGKKCE
ncbi:hypothetical protein FQN52_000933 [Onygenales sp. PD_12]|nr:hypothetical protein FQN52_000933 [Onygenales sp. PD_12]